MEKLNKFPILGNNTELSSEKLTELEKVRRVLHTKRKQLLCLTVEIARLKERERELALLHEDSEMKPIRAY